MAAKVHLSASRFGHLFGAEMSVSPARYVKTLRLVRAKELLETSFLSIKEVMVSVGQRCQPFRAGLQASSRDAAQRRAEEAERTREIVASRNCQ